MKIKGTTRKCRKGKWLAHHSNRKYAEEREQLRIGESQRKAEYRNELAQQIKQNQERDSLLLRSTEGVRLSLNLGNQVSNSRAEIDGDLKKAIQEKEQKRAEEKRLKENERSLLETKLRGYDSANNFAEQKNHERNLKRQYKEELDNQVRSRPTGNREGIQCTSLNVGESRKDLRAELRNGLDAQLLEKEALRKQQDFKNNPHVKEAPKSASTNQRSIVREIQLAFKTSLDEQKRENEERSNLQRAQDSEELQNHTGLKIGLYSPDYRKELKEGLSSQIQEKAEAKKREAVRNT